MTPTAQEEGVAVRIALLSTLERDPKPGSPRPAFASFAGTMIISKQLDLALQLQCERIVCLVDAVDREVVELQHRAESAGVKFRAIRQPSRLAGMVTAENELLVLEPGVLPDNAAVETVLATKGVLAFPADVAVPLDYERIDLELAWSGVMLVHGGLVERLADLPDDVDVPSTLMRLALQSGAPVHRLGADLLTEGSWHLNPDRKTLEEREQRWIEAQRRQIAFRAPGLAVAERAGARLARDILGQSTEPVPLAAAITSLIAAFGFALFGHPAIGLALTAIAALFAHMGGVVERLSRLNRRKDSHNTLQRIVGHAIDPAFVLMLVLASPEQLGVLRGFVPLVLIGLLRLGEQHASKAWRMTYADRILLGFLLAPAAFAGFATEAAATIALLVLATRFFAPFRGN